LLVPIDSSSSSSEGAVKKALLLLLVTASPAFGRGWGSARAEYADDLARARYEAALCEGAMNALIESQRSAANAQSLATFSRWAPAPPAAAPSDRSLNGFPAPRRFP
jgi:hypothetical protein